MRRNCNLELRLLPPTSSGGFLSPDYNTPYRHQPMLDLLSGSPKQEQQQQLTIFYNGKMAVCDVTELQARAILMLASGEMEEKWKSPSCSEPSSPMLQSQLYSPTTGLSMTRSLQRFLQKRKNRIQTTSPYHHH